MGSDHRKKTNVIDRTLLLLGVLFFGMHVHTAAQESDHTYTSESIQAGSRVYVQQCALCHGPQGETVDGINLRRGIFRTVNSDDDLRRVVTTGAAEGRMPAFSLSTEELEGVIAYIRAGFDPEGVEVRIGDAQQGLALFNGRGQCNACHRVNGNGPRTAPDLSDIGLLRNPAALQRALLEPQLALLPINRAVHIVTRDEETITGRRLNEDTYTVQVIDDQERLRSLIKEDLVRYEISDQPTHRPTSLSSEEVADLVAYMLSLRGLP